MQEIAYRRCKCM